MLGTESHLRVTPCSASPMGKSTAVGGPGLHGAAGPSVAEACRPQDHPRTEGRSEGDTESSRGSGLAEERAKN